MLDAFEAAFQAPLAGGSGFMQPSGTLLEYRDPHGDVEPIQNVLRLRVKFFLKIANGVAAIREEGHLLVSLHSLRFEQVEEAALGLLIDTMHQSKALARRRRIFGIVSTKRQNTLSRDNLE